MPLDATPQRIEIPGLADAVAHERLVRDAAFLPIRENIAGYEVLPMTVRHIAILSMANSPLLYGAIPSPAQLAQFLWAVSPQFSPDNVGAARRGFITRCREFTPATAPTFFFKLRKRSWELANAKKLKRAAEIIDACHKYVFEALQDKPPRARKVGVEPDYYSDACWFCATLAREFGWSEEAILNMPLKRVFQYINLIRRFHDPKALLFNPSESVANAWIAEQNKKGGAK